MGQVWGNVFVVFVAAPLAFIWAKTKYWPLHPIKVEIAHLHSKTSEMLGHHRQHALKLDALRTSHDEIHESLKNIHEKLDILMQNDHAHLHNE
jgi:hypothetical protein